VTMHRPTCQRTRGGEEVTRLQRLIKLVREEQDVVRQSKTPENVEALCRHQDRLLTYCSRNNQTAPYELFSIPEQQDLSKIEERVLAEYVNYPDLKSGLVKATPHQGCPQVKRLY